MFTADLLRRACQGPEEPEPGEAIEVSKQDLLRSTGRAVSARAAPQAEVSRRMNLASLLSSFKGELPSDGDED
jgi:hypothetical protein